MSLKRFLICSISFRLPGESARWPIRSRLFGFLYSMMTREYTESTRPLATVTSCLPSSLSPSSFWTNQAASPIQCEYPPRYSRSPPPSLFGQRTGRPFLQLKHPATSTRACLLSTLGAGRCRNQLVKTALATSRQPVGLRIVPTFLRTMGQSVLPSAAGASVSIPPRASMSASHPPAAFPGGADCCLCIAHCATHKVCPTGRGKWAPTMVAGALSG
jgi:hypothetical protein